MPLWSVRSIACSLTLLLAVGLCAEEKREPVGLELGAEALGKLVPLGIKDGRLVLDSAEWQKLKDADKTTAEERRKARRKKLAERMNVAEDQVPEQMVDEGGDSEVLIRLFNEVMNQAGGSRHGGGSQSSSNRRREISSDRPNARGKLLVENDGETFEITFQEHNAPNRILVVDVSPTLGLTIRLHQPDRKESVLLVQDSKGPVSAILNLKDGGRAFTAPTLDDLMIQAPEALQTALIRPLSDLGIRFPPTRFSPTVMAVACTGFSKPHAEVLKKADALIAQLSHDDQDTREKATQELIKLYPLAIHYIGEQVKSANDLEVKSRLERVALAHPGIARAIPYVKEAKLHEDKAYLLGVMGKTEFFRQAARTRLTELYGQDHGENAEAWPKP